MPCYVMLEVTAKPGTAPDMLEALGKLLPDTRSKDGSLGVEVAVNQDNPDNILFVMRWASRQHYQAYRDWREGKGDVRSFGDMTTSGLSTRFFDVTDV